MDSLIAHYPCVQDRDLMLCHGVAYQSGMQAGVYDSAYLAKIESYDETIAAAVNRGRCAFLSRHHLGHGATVLDIGAGDGSFVRAARNWDFDAKGYEIIPEAARRLQAAGLYASDPSQFKAVTLWDVIEHLQEPETLLRRVRRHLFVSLPIFEDLAKVRQSKHYRPGEHLYYWTADGFVEWMASIGFCALESSSHETDAGREGIGAFAFHRVAD